MNVSTVRGTEKMCTGIFFDYSITFPRKPIDVYLYLFSDMSGHSKIF